LRSTSWESNGILRSVECTGVTGDITLPCLKMEYEL
jgi:hypothetical protein